MSELHPMLLPVHDLLRREVDDGLFYVEHDIGTPGTWLWHVELVAALVCLHAALRGNGQATVLFTPGTDVVRDKEWLGWRVVGWNHVLLLPDGSEIHAQRVISFHHYRWTARRAANAWMRRAQAVSERIAAELSSALQVEAS